jgi:hypothetical protein
VGRRVEGLLPDAILSRSINAELWMREKEQALQLHLQRFGEVGRAFAAPARVNLIGEHTDYTGGLVMPMANRVPYCGRTQSEDRQQGGLLLGKLRRRGFVRDSFDGSHTRGAVE